MVKKKALKSKTNKPFGFTKIGKSYALVFGTKANPKLGKTRFRTKRGAFEMARKKLTRKTPVKKGKSTKRITRRRR